MNYSVVTIGDKKYVECVSSEIQLMSDQDTLDLIAATMENDTGLLMIHGEVLSEDFFKLSTGVAGAMLQKLVNYQVRTAVIISDELASRGRFGEMVLESNKGSHFRFFSTKEEAENWLISIR
jgi:PadR family transcriptional regulator, regulatory protein AphA